MKGKTKLQTTDLHCSSLDTLPLSTCTLTLCPFHKTCSNAGKILSARDKCCRHSSRFYHAANKFWQPSINIAPPPNRLGISLNLVSAFFGFLFPQRFVM